MWKYKNERVNASKNLFYYENSENTDWKNCPNQLFPLILCMYVCMYGWIGVCVHLFIYFHYSWHLIVFVLISGV